MVAGYCDTLYLFFQYNLTAYTYFLYKRTLSMIEHESDETSLKINFIIQYQTIY